MADRFQVLAPLLKAVSRGVFGLARDVVDVNGLPPPSLAVMRQVFEQPGITVSELSRQASMAKSYVSKTVESLARAGLLEKRGDSSDHRLVRIHPTQQAMSHFQRMHANVRRRFSAVISTLPEEKVDALIDGLRALRTALEQATEKETGGDGR